MSNLDWVPVSKRLPARGSYLVYAPDLFNDPEMKESEPMAIVSMTEFGWSFYDELITHWMPLPESPVNVATDNDKEGGE